MIKCILQKLRKQLEQSCLAKHFFALKLCANQQGQSTAFQAENDNIQATHLKLCKLIERYLCKLQMGGVPWSPKLQGYRNAIKLWSIILRKQKGAKVSNTGICCYYMAKTSVWDVFEGDVSGAEVNLKAVHHKYMDTKKEAVVWQDEFLQYMAVAKANKKGTSVDQE
jgi:hypothetical protein